MIDQISFVEKSYINKKIRRIFLEILGCELYGDNIEWHITALENRQIAFHKHVINSIEATVRGITLR